MAAHTQTYVGLSRVLSACNGTANHADTLNTRCSFISRSYVLHSDSLEDPPQAPLAACEWEGCSESYTDPEALYVSCCPLSRVHASARAAYWNGTVLFLHFVSVRVCAISSILCTSQASVCLFPAVLGDALEPRGTPYAFCSFLVTLLFIPASFMQ